MKEKKSGSAICISINAGHLFIYFLHLGHRMKWSFQNQSNVRVLSDFHGGFFDALSGAPFRPLTTFEKTNSRFFVDIRRA